MRKPRLILMIIIGVAVATSALAQARRLVGHIKDDLGAPIEGARITVTSPDVAIKLEGKTNKKGDFQIVIASGAAHNLHVAITKDGFAAYENDVTIDPGAAIRTDVKLQNIARFAAAQGPTDEEKAVDLHNAGAEASSAKDWATAAKNFDDSLALREASASTHLAAATAAWNLKDFAKAESHARRSIELEAGQPYALSLLASSLESQGKAEEALAINQQLASTDPKLRANLAYDRGAELANGGKDKEALVAFEEAVTADPELAEAHYALGLTAYRAGDMPRAKTALLRYVELSPDGDKVATANALLKTIK